MHQNNLTKHQNNCFILKCFFKITFLTIWANWVHSHNFRDIVELEADCGAKEIYPHLLTAPKSAKYHSPLYYQCKLKLWMVVLIYQQLIICPHLKTSLLKINLQQAHVACMDTPNINSGKKNGLKRHLEHKV